MCKKKNIKLIHGRPYYPQSQGAVEKLNDLIAKSLSASLISYTKKSIKTAPWDIENALKAWTINSNRNIHSVTKMIPQKAIQLEDNVSIQQVQENIRNYY